MKEKMQKMEEDKATNRLSFAIPEVALLVLNPMRARYFGGLCRIPPKKKQAQAKRRATLVAKVAQEAGANKTTTTPKKESKPLISFKIFPRLPIELHTMIGDKLHRAERHARSKGIKDDLELQWVTDIKILASDSQISGYMDTEDEFTSFGQGGDFSGMAIFKNLKQLIATQNEIELEQGIDDFMASGYQQSLRGMKHSLEQHKATVDPLYTVLELLYMDFASDPETYVAV
ncbi:hypothetical protein BDZ45DRAFT_688442 [Acephala macrosclerotiorum]|nr:hypothetical protein BDZ45DRAFT_688442 [Acephala macrosclerotiorum]